MLLPPNLKDTQVSTPYPFQGGIDLVSSALAIPAGRLIAGINYEPLVDGYARCQGYERTDGRLPSSAAYWTLDFTDGSSQVYAGTVVRGATSGATGRVLLDPADLLGEWGAGTAAGTLVLGEVTGDFAIGEALLVAGIQRATADGVAQQNAQGTPDEVDQWAEAAQTRLRSLIQQVPGSGPVRGGFVLDGALYAVRDNDGGNHGIIHKATELGWVAQSFATRMSFELGLVEIHEGDVVTGATSTASGTVERVVTRTGGWGAAADVDKAAGLLILSGVAGAFQAGEVLKVGAVAVATADTNSNEVKLPAGGRYIFKVKNFYGAANRMRVYGVNGVGTAFEYDGGSVLVPIDTGMAEAGHPDTPNRIFDIANHLGLTFAGGSIQFSSTGEPCVFNAILGAGEIGMGDDITDVIDSTDSAVIFYGRNKICALTGRDIDSFVFDEITDEAGALAWTAQRIGRTLSLDLRGLRDLNTTAAWGNFKAGAISELFDPFLKAKRRAGATPVASLRSREKAHYRLFYDDRSGFSVFMGRKLPEMIPFELGFQVYSTWTGEMDDGSEGLFAAGEDGFVYRLDSGTSYDGAGIRGFVMTPFSHLGGPGMNKRAQAVSVEMDAAPRTRIGILAQFDYADGNAPVSGSHDFVVAGGGGVWDVSDWDAFYWSSAYSGIAEADIAGTGRNLSILIAASSSPVEPPHTLQNYTVRWTPRGRVKRTAK